MNTENGSRNVLFLVLAFFSFSTYAASTGESDYKLGRGDEVQIQVHDEADLSMSIKVTDTGTITYPFIGEISVVGMSVSGLESFITEQLLGDYLIEPRVSVSISEYRPFYIYGEVKNPGGFQYQPGMTVRNAVALAGGFTERASRSKMFVVSESGSESNRQRVSLDDAVRAGDSLTIEQSFF